MASVSVSEKGVFIEGREYVPRDTVLSDEAMKQLALAYSLAWANGYYNPISSDKLWIKIVREISDCLSAVNKDLHFKR